MRYRSCSPFAAVLLVVLSALLSPARAETIARFRITFDAAAQPQPYTGRIYVAFADPNARAEPRRQIHDWFRPAQVIALDVSAVPAAAEATLDAKNSSLAFPKAFSAIAPGSYRVQAIAPRSLDHPQPGRGEGDLYSQPALIDFDPAGAGSITLKLDQVAKRREPQESERVKYFDLKSDKLSKFAARDVTVRAGVYLPKDWSDDADKSWPTLWFGGGFGSDASLAASLGRMLASMPGGDNVLIIFPDATCYRGCSVFADSANNGPWGAMLIDEMIPAVERKFHGAGPSKRYVSGMSSGGWAGLWLQITYPDHFAECWSFCPDPVDFRDFQRINLYQPDANMYTDPDGNPRGVARAREGEEPRLLYKDFVAQETVLGPGGQIHSFEAVFEPHGQNGEPLPLFDRATGRVDPAVAKAWEPYDIRLVLERRWAELAPKLKGKLHIAAGGRDTFYLEGAAKLLKESLEKLGSDATVEIIEGMPHSMHPPTMQAMMRKIGGVPDEAKPASGPGADR